MPLAAHGVTHTGRRRTNEDAMLVDGAAGLFVVADGMGGHNAGEVASAVAVRTIQEALAGTDPDETGVADALCAANDRVLEVAAGDPEYAGMGTTAVAVHVRDGGVVFGSVGDSRIYLWHGGTLAQLTRDDSWVSRVLPDEALSTEDVQNHPMRHVLTKVIGLRPDMEPAVGVTPFVSGDVLLLCSDGLHGSLTEHEIGQALSRTDAVDTIAADLVARALAAGAADNVTAVVVRSE
jgi:protein phosphatase